MLDLRTQFGEIRDDVLAAVTRIFDAQYFILGPEVAGLEREIASYCGVEFGVGCASGSDALLLALMALDVKAGDEVVTTPFTFFATAGAIARLGAKPVFVDIDPSTYNLDPSLLEPRMTWRTRAIIPIHLYGQAADMDGVRNVADLHGVPIIEDAAQAIGAEYNGRRAGSLGHMACFSFYPTKNLGGAGDGGMLTTDDIELAEKVKMLRDHGMRPRYYYRFVGVNSRLDEVQAAVLRIKLSRLEQWQDRRAAIAESYNRLFDQAGLGDKLSTPVVAPGRRHVYHQYVVRIRDGRRDALREYLRGFEIGSEIYYPVPLHLQDCFRTLGYKEGDFPESELAAREVLALPIYPSLTASQQEAVVGRIAEFLNNNV